MPNDGFGSKLWKNVQAFKLGPDGRIEAPVRASSRQGIVIGVDAIAKSDASESVTASSPPARDVGGGLGKRVRLRYV